METHADEGHVMDDVMTDGEQNERPAIPASDMTSRTFLEGLQSLDPETLRQRLLDMHDTLTKLEAEKRQLEEQLTQRSVQNNDDEEQQPPPSDQEKKKATGERSRKISDVFFGDIQPGRSRFHYPGLAVHRSSLSTTPSSYQSANSYRSDSRASISGSIGGGLGAGSASGSGQVRSLTKRLSDGMLNFSGVGAGASSSSQRGLQFYGRKPSWVDERGFYTPKPPVDIVVTVSDTGYSPADEQHSAPPPLYGADAGRRQRKMAVPPYSDGYSGSNLFPTSQYNLSDKRYSESVIRPTANERYGGRGSTDNGIGAQIPKMNMAKRLSEGVLNLTGAKMRSSPRGSQDHTKLIPSESLSQETSGTPPLADITPQIIQYRESGIKVSEEDTKVQLTTPAVEPKPKKRKFKLKRKKESLSDLKKELSVDEHKIALNELQQRLDTDLEKGLTDLQAEERLLNDGLNALTPLKDKPEIVKFLEQLFTGFNLLLWVGAVLSFIVYALQYLDPNNHPDPSDIVVGVSEIVVVLITGGLGYHQQATSSRIMESFLHMVPQYALVVRGGERKNVPAEELVVGDIVEVKFGDRAPADLRVLSSQSLKVDNASLTGESEPQSRGPDFTNENPLETKNLIFFSTNVVEGFAKGVVINTGDRTVMGRIANLTSSMSSSETPIARELSRLVKIIVVIAVAMGVIFIAIIIGEGYDPVTAIIFLVGIIMGNVPEGLLATVTVILTLSAKRMARKNCLVKNLESVETLGSTSVICSDKTGTLTQNRMTVAHMWFDNEIFEAETSDAQQEFSAQHRYIVPSWVALSRVAMLCNRAEFKNGQSHLPIMKRECNGDASETAILKCCELTCGDVMAYRLKNTKVCEIPFNSVNKYQLSIHEMTMPDGDLYNLLVMKGAPERIIEKCKTIAIDGEDVVLTEEWITAYKKAYEDLGSLGERVLGFADLLLPKSNFPIGYPFDVDEENFPLDGLRFVGLMSMIDPPRPAVPDAVRKCRSAGIKVIMVTGDHPVTAKAIAKAVGIISEGAETVEDIAARRNIPVELVDASEAKAIVVHGGQLKNMSDSELRKVLSSYSEIVFARTSPQQKLIIVEGCQNLGNIVAVTGDGVNDSPALKKSDIGVAMGITGSDVSKQSADMVLMDDNFASIVCGVEEGRLVFDNLRKTVCYTVTHTLPELFPFLLYLILNIPLATGTIALLFIDIITDIIPAVNLAYEKPESDIMNRKPRDQKKDRLVDAKLLGLTCGQNGVIESMGGMFVYCVILATNGFLPDMLVGLRAQWENVACNNLADSYGQEWTYAQRKMIEYSSYTAYFVAVCVIQWFNLLICKTLRSSIVEQGMYNHYLHVAVCIETFFVILVSFIPRLDYAFLMATMDWTWFFAPLPFGLLLLIYNEGRKLVCRYLPEGSWAHRELLL